MSTSLLDEPAVLPSTSSGRCLSADKSGIYKFTSGSGQTRRKIPRDPSLN
jgi:hypothetical protein